MLLIVSLSRPTVRSFSPLPDRYVSRRGAYFVPLLISRCYVPYPRRHWRAAWKGYVFKKDLEGLFIDRMEQNEEITAKFMNDEAFQEIVRRHLLKEVYQQIRGETEVEKRPE